MCKNNSSLFFYRLLELRLLLYVYYLRNTCTSSWISYLHKLNVILTSVIIRRCSARCMFLSILEYFFFFSIWYCLVRCTLISRKILNWDVILALTALSHVFAIKFTLFSLPRRIFISFLYTYIIHHLVFSTWDKYYVYKISFLFVVNEINGNECLCECTVMCINICLKQAKYRI